MNRAALALAVLGVIILSLFAGIVMERFLPNHLTVTSTSMTTGTTVSTVTSTVYSTVTSVITSTTTEIVFNTSGLSSTLGTIGYPSNYATLTNYTLSLINADRANYSLTPVTISPIQSGQQHAYSMLKLQYFSHWDAQGYKPYMRYSLLNGTGDVAENVAYYYTYSPTFFSTASVEHALSTLEYQMMYNDSICCNNGHRENILNPFHNRVSIGIAYDSSHVYFVEDFENYYANLQRPIFGGGNSIQLVGQTVNPLNPYAVLVFYDKPPDPLNTSTLNSEFRGPYNQGNFTGGALPPCNNRIGCSVFSGYLTVYASIWQVTSTSINIQFSLGNFVQKYGSGVYTAYLVQGNQTNPEFLTSISIFIS